MNPFHLAIPVRNLKITRAFYKDVLECSEGRSAEKWVDFDFFGHQLRPALMCMCMRMRMCACAHVCMCMWTCVHLAADRHSPEELQAHGLQRRPEPRRREPDGEEVELE